MSRSLVTTRSATARPYSARGPPLTVCAISEAKSNATAVGLCFFTAATNECVLCHIADSQTYIRTLHKLDVYNPSEIFLPASAIENKSRLALLLEELFPEATLTPVGRKWFDPDNCISLVTKLAPPNFDLDQIRFELADKAHTASAATACLLTSRERSSNTGGAPLRSVRFKYETSESCMVIDSRTLRSLELVENKHEHNGPSLLKVINRTQTPMGLRVLRTNILQPSTSVETIELRLQAVEELVNKEAMAVEASKCLKEFGDFDRLLTSILVASNKNSVTQRVNYILLLKQCIQAATQLHEVLTDAESSLLVGVRDTMSTQTLNVLTQLINAVINEDCRWAKSALELQTQQAYAVRSGANGFIDAAREVYKQVTDMAFEKVASYGETFKLPIEPRYDSRRGFTMRMKVGETDVVLGSLPAEFINRARKKQYYEFTSLDLVKYSARVKNAMSEIMLLTDQVITALIDNIAELASDLFKIAEAVAVLDMVQAFAKLVISSRGYVKPQFSQAARTIAIRGGRHPVLETLTTFVANDVYISDHTDRVTIITGTNMSGKSVYLRQVAMLCVMAQLGCYVPADFAQFFVLSSLHARICHDVPHHAAASSSSFSLEMTEMSHFLKLATESSLLIIDELGRGSSVSDGLAMCMAITEHLAAIGTPTLLATHFHELAQVLSCKPGISSITMKVDLHDPKRMRMYYKTLRGDAAAMLAPQQMRYGIRLAKAVPFPDSFLEYADEVANKLESIRLNNSASSALRRRLEATNAILDLKAALVHIAHDSVDVETKQALLRRLQHKAVEKLSQYR